MLFCLIYIKVEQLQLTNNQINLLTVMQKWTFPKSQIYCDHPGIFHFFELISPWKSMFFPQFWCTPLEFQRFLLYPLEFSIDIFNRGGYNFFFLEMSNQPMGQRENLKGNICFLLKFRIHKNNKNKTYQQHLIEQYC